jgi:hypothetical protein
VTEALSPGPCAALAEGPVLAPTGVPPGAAGRRAVGGVQPASGSSPFRRSRFRPGPGQVSESRSGWDQGAAGVSICTVKCSRQGVVLRMLLPSRRRRRPQWPGSRSLAGPSRIRAGQAPARPGAAGLPCGARLRLGSESSVSPVSESLPVM